jgi:hypothetical protein
MNCRTRLTVGFGGDGDSESENEDAGLLASGGDNGDRIVQSSPRGEELTADKLGSANSDADSDDLELAGEAAVAVVESVVVALTTTCIASAVSVAVDEASAGTDVGEGHAMSSGVVVAVGVVGIDVICARVVEDVEEVAGDRAVADDGDLCPASVALVAPGAGESDGDGDGDGDGDSEVDGDTASRLSSSRSRLSSESSWRWISLESGAATGMAVEHERRNLVSV